MQVSQKMQAIPEEILRYWAEKFTLSEFKVLHYICKETFYASVDEFFEEKLYVSREDIAKGTGVKKETVRKSVSSLQDCGLLISNGKVGDKAAYMIDYVTFEGI